jgi:DNA-binding transcriptional LysR family regulator
MYNPEQAPLLLEAALDVGFIRDGAPMEGLRMTPLSHEPFYAVLPQSHRLAKEREPIAPRELRNEKFVLFSPRIVGLTFERTIAVCTADGFTPEIHLEAPQWVSIVSLVAAGVGVSICPANVSRLNIPGAVFRPLRSKAWSSIDLWTPNTIQNPAAARLLAIAKVEFAKSGPKASLK